jgi:glutamate---cysteine ligase / carboxylate-amine ligase
MPITFVGSPAPTLGVEVELQLIDPESRDLVNRSEDLLARCSARGLERVKAEITLSMVEVDTEISRDVKECRGYLEKRLRELQAVSHEAGIRLASSGTHPFQLWTNQSIFPSERYRYLEEKYQWLARRLSVFGLHVHVGVESGEKAIAIGNAAVRYLPHLLALTASSPYWQGVDTGMQSCRMAVMQSFPISGLPYYFPDWQEFEKYCDTLLHSEAIVSLKDLYWFIRPSPDFGTLEFRICDGIPTLSETIAIAAMIQALVVWIDEGFAKGSRSKTISMRRYWIAPENLWSAARDGLDAQVIISEDGKRRRLADDILNLLEQLTPVAKKLNSLEELMLIKTMIGRGNSAQRQRAVYRENQDYAKVVDSVIEEFETDRPGSLI